MAVMRFTIFTLSVLLGLGNLSYAAGASTEGLSRQLQALRTAMDSYAEVQDARMDGMDTRLGDMETLLNQRQTCSERGEDYAPDQIGVDSDGCLNMDPYTVESDPSGAYGHVAGGYKALKCPKHHALIGMRLRIHQSVERIDITCAPIIDGRVTHRDSSGRDLRLSGNDMGGINAFGFGGFDGSRVNWGPYSNEVSCPDGQAITGFNGTQHNILGTRTLEYETIQSTQITCQPHSNWRIGSTRTTSPVFGNNSGRAYERRCASGYYISGMHGVRGSRVNQIGIFCTKFDH